MFITNSCSLYQYDAKNAQKSKRLSPNERKYADNLKVTKFGIDTLFNLCKYLDKLLATTSSACVAVNI